MQELPQELISKALALTGKTMEDIKEDVYHDFNWDTNFSIEKFCFFLLSPEFIEKYAIFHLEMWVSWFSDHEASLFRFSKSIYEYQKWNSQPLIDLLSKI